MRIWRCSSTSASFFLTNRDKTKMMQNRQNGISLPHPLSTIEHLQRSKEPVPLFIPVLDPDFQERRQGNDDDMSVLYHQQALLRIENNLRGGLRGHPRHPPKYQ
jgi:hypothetical protein